MMDNSAAPSGTPGYSAGSTRIVTKSTLTYPLFALLALLAVGMLLLLPGVPLLAQDSSTIEYPEKGEGAVATFTATDPENAGAVKWTLGLGTTPGLRDRGEQRGADVRGSARLRGCCDDQRTTSTS